MSVLIYGPIGLVLLGLVVGVLLIHRRQRLLVDSLIALLLVGFVTCALLYHRNKQRLSEQYQLVKQAIAMLNEQVAYQSALTVEHESSGGSVFPQFVSPLWFKSGLPANPMVSGWHAWLDVAPASDAQEHPPDPVITHSGQAGIWYNPNSGTVRARVIDQGTDSATLQLYNDVNETDLKALSTSNSLSRRPLPLMSVLVAQEAKAEARKKAKAEADALAKAKAEAQAAAEAKAAADARAQAETRARAQAQAQAEAEAEAQAKAQARAQAAAEARAKAEAQKRAQREEADPSQEQERVMPAVDGPSQQSDSE